MARNLNLKISINKNTGQLSTFLPRRKISQKKLKEILKSKKVKIELK